MPADDVLYQVALEADILGPRTRCRRPRSCAASTQSPSPAALACQWFSKMLFSDDHVAGILQFEEVLHRPQLPARRRYRPDWFRGARVDELGRRDGPVVACRPAVRPNTRYSDAPVTACHRTRTAPWTVVVTVTSAEAVERRERGLNRPPGDHTVTVNTGWQRAAGHRRR